MHASGRSTNLSKQILVARPRLARACFAPTWRALCVAPVECKSAASTPVCSAPCWAAPNRPRPCGGKSSQTSGHSAAEDQNKLVMDFLLTEGFADAAAAFQLESGTDMPLELASVSERMAARAAVAAGDVAGAIELVNQMDPELLENNASLLFALQRQRLIELIACGEVEAALQFAQEYLAPLAAESVDRLDALERALALLAFENAESVCDSLRPLLQPEQRAVAAAQLNAAILEKQGHESEPRLHRLLKLMLYAQTQLAEHLSAPVMRFDGGEWKLSQGD